MEQQKQLQGQPVAQIELPLPHFDDEATLLSARPVVPLSEVKNAARWRRLLAFVLAGFVALLAGTLYGTRVYTTLQKGPSVNEIGRNDSGQLSQVAAPLTEGGGTSEQNAVVTHNEEPDSSETTDFERKQTPPISRASTKPEMRNIRDRSSDGQKDEIEVKNPQAQEASTHRRLREENQLRRQRARNSDGLLRIHEIFEGPQRP